MPSGDSSDRWRCISSGAVCRSTAVRRDSAARRPPTRTASCRSSSIAAPRTCGRSLRYISAKPNSIRSAAHLWAIVSNGIFLFVAEDRTLDGQSLLHPRDDSDGARAAHYGTARLRHLAGRIKGSRHGDLWRQFRLLADALSGEPDRERARRRRRRARDPRPQGLRLGGGFRPLSGGRGASPRPASRPGARARVPARASRRRSSISMRSATSSAAVCTTWT